MGPIALFDKSFLQAISLDESVWFDRFFMPVACPIFFLETLGDLGKDASKRGSAEFSVVKDVAQKFPELGGSPCSFHIEMAFQNLLGHDIPMDSRIPRPGGRYVDKGVVFEASPEELAFKRWQEGRFEDAERIAASTWRQSLAELDLDKVRRELRLLGIDGKTCNTLEQAKDLAFHVVSSRQGVMSVLALAMTFLHVPQNAWGRIIEHWKRRGSRPLSDYAPYAAHVVAVELYFQFGLAAHLIGSDRPSNRIDIAYLFYLPFCQIFISQDKLHRRAAPPFLRKNQEFVWGVDLKAALAVVNTHFSDVPEDVREKGIMAFADTPPDGNLVADLWDRLLRQEREQRAERPPNPEREAELVKRLKGFSKSPSLPPGQTVNMDDAEMISIARTVRKKRGSWWQVPKDLKDDGED